MPGWGAALQKAAAYVGGAGTAAHAAMGRGLGAAGRTAAYGGMAGGMYGATMGDSMLGGAVSGATLGLTGRYARAGMRGAMQASRYGYQGGAAFTGAMARRAGRDYRGAVMRSNSAFSQIRSSLKGMGY
jgi:hypothetical protein